MVFVMMIGSDRSKSIRVRDGLRPGKESEEDPEEDFQNAGIEKAP